MEEHVWDHQMKQNLVTLKIVPQTVNGDHGYHGDHVPKVVVVANILNEDHLFKTLEENAVMCNTK